MFYRKINSEIVKNILSTSKLKKITIAKPKLSQTILFTIGYEGISLETYLNRLIENDVKLLVDVRSNPLSMKYGFSKNTLNKYCQSIGIEYEHIPDPKWVYNHKRENIFPLKKTMIFCLKIIRKTHFLILYLNEPIYLIC